MEGLRLVPTWLAPGCLVLKHLAIIEQSEWRQWDQILSAFTGASWDCPGGAQTHGGRRMEAQRTLERQELSRTAAHLSLSILTFPHLSPLCFKCLILTQVSKPSRKLNQNTFFFYLEKSEDTQRECFTSQRHTRLIRSAARIRTPGLPLSKIRIFPVYLQVPKWDHCWVCIFSQSGSFLHLLDTTVR